MSRIPVIVAPVDFTTSWNQGLRAAAWWANELGGELHVLHVVSDPATRSWSMHASGEDVQTLASDWMQRALRTLDGLVATLPFPATPVTTAVARGKPGEQIVAYAEDHEADVIVMVSHDHGRVARCLLGSVADYVVRTAPCPVLTIPAHGAAVDRTGAPLHTAA